MKKPEKNSSIRTKLVLAMLIIVLLFFGVSFWVWFRHLQSESRKNIVDNMTLRIGESNSLFEMEIKEMRNLMIQTAMFSQGERSEKLFELLVNKEMPPQEYIDNRVQATKYLEDIWEFRKYCKGVIIGNGTQIVASVGTNRVFNEIKQYPWYQAALLDGAHEQIISPYFANQEAHKMNHIFTIAQPIHKRNGSTIGSILTDIDYAIFEDMYVSKDNYDILIINDLTGELVFTTAKKYEKNEFNKLLQSKVKSSETANFDLEYDGEVMTLVTDDIETVPWKVFGIANESIYTNSFWDATWNLIGLTALACIIVIIMIYFVVSYFTKGIISLTNLVKTVAWDDLQFHVQIKSRDEVEDLADQFTLMMERIKLLITAVKTEEVNKRKAEIRALQAQINPHFLYNTLNTVKFLSTLSGTANIHTITDSFMKMMYINMDDRSFITLKEEKEYLTNYLKIQDYRYADCYHYEIDLKEELTHYYIPKLLLQPLVENAVFHGVAGAENNREGFIGILFYKEEEHIVISIYDNGKGIPENKRKDLFTKDKNKDGHIGLYNVKERIHFYFEERGTIEISSHEGIFTKQLIRVPIISEEEVKEYV